jgi:glycosyltransferase involved in cell wall biosynthesis
MKPRISAVINTLNEESNLANALRSVASWVDEIVVVDMHSEDRTVEIARSFGAKVFLHERMGSADPARAFAEEQATGDWIFSLDADEIAPLELSRELVQIAQNDIADFCYIPELNYFAGFPLMHSGWGPKQDRHPRFYRKGSLVHSPLIHTGALAKEGSRILTLEYRPGIAIIHLCYLNVSHCIQKLDRYTDIEASQMTQQGRKMRIWDIVIRPFLEFLNRYFRRQGFRDGVPGFYYCFLMLFYRMTQAMKLRELRLTGSAENVRESFQGIAEQQISRYEEYSRLGKDSDLR